MEKIIFINIPMKKELNSLKYKAEGNSEISYDGEVVFPINAVMANTITKNDEVKVVLLKKLDIEHNCDNNVEVFKKELNKINEKIGAKLNYKVIETPFEEETGVNEKLLVDMVNELKEKAMLYADITYGPKSLPIVLFYLLNFAERFFGCEIKNIIYGKVNYVAGENGKTVPINPKLCDMTSLYYLNSITNTMECKNSQDAKVLLEKLLSI